MRFNISKTITATLAVIGGLVIFSAIIGAIIAANDTKEPEYRRDDIEVKVEQDFQERYTDTISPAEKNAYMGECTKESNYSYCKCTFDYFNTNLTPAEFRQMSLNIDNEIPEIFWDAVAQCIGLYE